VTVGGEDQIILKGKRGRKFPHLEGLKLSRDGESMAWFSSEKMALMLLNTETGRTIQELSATDSVMYEFSKISNQLAFAEPGANAAKVVSAYGSDIVTLEAITETSVDYQIVRHGYTVKGIRWYSTDLDLPESLNLMANERELVVHWQVMGNYWRLSDLVLASLDQGFEFEADGSLNENASDYVAKSR
jgi:hypothetical protein